MAKPLYLSILLFQLVCSEKIVVFHHMASYSHRVQTWALADALASKGHQVSYITPFLAKETNRHNITELATPEHVEKVQETIQNNFQLDIRLRGEMENMYDFLFDYALDVCEVVLTAPGFKKWMEQNSQADLLIIDNCFSECGVALAHKLGAKHIIFSTVSLLGHEYDMLGLLPESFAVPELETYAFTPPLNFFERILNTYETLKWRWAHYSYVKKLDTRVREWLEIGEMPFLDDLMKNTSLVFYTGDVVTEFPRQLPPLFVNVAGIHARKPESALPKEMEEFISTNATKGDDGFVYISLGSMLISSHLPQDMKDVFFNVIKSYPHIKFLWKWNGPAPSNIPENLYLSEWFPQWDVLGHEKIRGFITQCGRPSLLEALFNGVNMIAFPIVADQGINADRMEAQGAIVSLEISELNFEDLKNAVHKILYDPDMKAKVKRLQQVFLDRPMSPVETGVWWTEYVLRHPDTSHLRPVGNDQYWFVRRSVDVWAFLTLSALVVLGGITALLYKLTKLYFSGGKNKVE